jgi:hypothetical protein
MQHEHNSLIILQRAWRSYLARTLISRLRRQRAALDIQRWARGCSGRAKAAHEKKRLLAVLILQRSWRGITGRDWDRWQLTRARRTIAAVVSIQRAWRSLKARVFASLVRCPVLRFCRRYGQRQRLTLPPPLRKKRPHHLRVLAAVRSQPVYRDFTRRTFIAPLRAAPPNRETAEHYGAPSVGDRCPVSDNARVVLALTRGAASLKSVRVRPLAPGTTPADLLAFFASCGSGAPEMNRALYSIEWIRAHPLPPTSPLPRLSFYSGRHRGHGRVRLRDCSAPGYLQEWGAPQWFHHHCQAQCNICARDFG